MSRIRVTLADDHPVVLAGMKALLDSADDIVVVDEATDGLTAVESVKTHNPDIAILDISMPELSGLEVAHKLATERPDVRLLALTVHEDRAYVQPMMQAGARGYLLKRSAAEELIRAIRAIAGGGIYLDPSVAEKALPGSAEPPTARSDAAELGPRETEVLQLIAQGFSNKEIAGRLDVSVKTVETHKARALEKLGLRTRSDIVRYGAARRWLDDLSGR